MGTAKSELTGPRTSSPGPRDTLMSTARVESLPPEPAHHQIVRRTVEACRLAKEAAGAAAEGIATGSNPLLNSLRQRERELDTLDMEIDTAVTPPSPRSSPPKPANFSPA